ncbi:uncharacterized protein LOC144238124 [Crocuta crocuta]
MFILTQTVHLETTVRVLPPRLASLLPPGAGRDAPPPPRGCGADWRSLRAEEPASGHCACAGSSPDSRSASPKVPVRRVDHRPAQLHAPEKGKENSPGAPLASLGVTKTLFHLKPGSFLLCSPVRAAVSAAHPFEASCREELVVGAPAVPGRPLPGWILQRRSGFKMDDELSKRKEMENHQNYHKLCCQLNIFSFVACSESRKILFLHYVIHRQPPYLLS